MTKFIVDLMEPGTEALVASTFIAVFSAVFLPQIIAGFIIWNMINELQLMAHLPIFSVAFPANAFVVYERIADIAMFDIYETGDLIQEWFGVDNEAGPHSIELDRLSYNYDNMLSNMGANLFLWAAIPTAILLSLIFKFFGRWSIKCRIVYNKFK